MGSEAGAEPVGVDRHVQLGAVAVGADARHALLVAQRVLAAVDGDRVEAIGRGLVPRRRPVPGLDEGRAVAGAVHAVDDAAAAREVHPQLVAGGRDGVAVHVPAAHAQRGVDRPDDEGEGL